ncbi:GNAT family N-acetyltransferase [Sediminicola arcticus]|uniref:GNAT family N-acetyltransferase n=1 Tax=Sediminicola arcticus TaxID=1574308 RepID=A0ABV2SWY4_9FLAO
MNSKNTYQLLVEDFSTEAKICFYKACLQQKWNNNTYYRYEYLNYYENENNTLKYFIFKKDNEAIILMPFLLRVISVLNQTTNYFDVTTPYGYGGPLLIENLPEEEYQEFWKHVKNWYKNNGVVTEFVRFGLIDNQHFYDGYLLPTLKNIKGRILKDQEQQWDAFLPKVRNNYRAACNHNLSFKIFNKEAITSIVISSFYEIYMDTMKRRSATSYYYFSNSYFQNLILSNPNNFYIAFTYFENKPISTELIIGYKDDIYAFLGGTLSEYFECRPNDFLRVEVIKWASINQKKSYILGGGRVDGDGLYKNKKALFPKDDDVVFYTGRKVIDEDAYEYLNQLASEKSSDANIQVDEHFFPKYRKFCT